MMINCTFSFKNVSTAGEVLALVPNRPADPLEAHAIMQNDHLF